MTDSNPIFPDPGLEAELKLTHLDAGFNQLKELGPQNVPNGVETLLLNDNHIATLVPYTFFKVCITSKCR